VIVRRERPHPGAQLSFTDHDGHRFQAILTDQEGAAIAALECRHRARARAENEIADDKDTGLAKLPFRAFAMNAVWLELVLIAHDLLAWTRRCCLAASWPALDPGAFAIASSRRRPPRLLGPSRPAASAGGLALGRATGEGFREAEGPARPQPADTHLPRPPQPRFGLGARAPQSLLALGA
jgi:hypothetical protein